MRKTLHMNELRVAFIPDGYVELKLEKWFSDPGGSQAEFQHAYRASVGFLLIESPEESFLIDTGLGHVQIQGDATAPPLGELRGGQTPDIMDVLRRRKLSIAITHAHEDHVGWLRPIYDAVRVNRTFVGEADRQRLAQLTGIRTAVGLLGGERVSKHITAIASPGHTAGHMSYLIHTGSHRALIFGDVFHHPLQISRPHLTPWSDESPSQALASRKSTLERLQQPGMVGIGYHFGDQLFGRVVDHRWVSLFRSSESHAEQLIRT